MAMPLLVVLGFQAATALVGLVMLTTSWRCRILVAVVVGRRLGRYMPMEKFQRALYWVLVALSGLLFL